MSIKTRLGGSLQTASAISVKIAGVLRTVRTIRIMVGGSLQTVYSTTSALSVSATSALGVTTGTACTTSSSTATVSGGTAPFTYAWTLISSSGGNTPSITSPTLASTTFKQIRTGVADESNTATFRCTVTDSLGSTATDDATASFEFTSSS